MLDRTGDADRDIQFRRDDLAGLADLQVARHIAGVDRGARSADRGADLVGQLVDDLEVFRRAQCAATRDDLACPLQVGAVALALGQFDEARMRGQADFDAGGFDGRIRRSVRRGRPRGRADGRDDDAGDRCLDRDDRVAGVDRTLEYLRRFDAHDIGDLGHAEQGGDTRHQVLAEGRRRRKHVAVALAGNGGDLRRQHRGQRMRVLGAAHGEDLADPFDLCGLGGDAGGVGGQHEHVDGFGLDGERRADAACGAGIELAVQVFGDDQDLRHGCSSRLCSGGGRARRGHDVRPGPWPSARRPVRPRP